MIKNRIKEFRARYEYETRRLSKSSRRSTRNDYVFAGFLITPINSCLHPLSCISVIIARNEAILGLSLPQNNVPLALLSICVWGIASTLLAKIKLSTRK